MSEHIPSTGIVGEGFAYARWHALRWGNGVCTGFDAIACHRDWAYLQDRMQ